jgi:hypothetical protein
MYRRALLATVCGLAGCTGAVPNPFGGDGGSGGGSRTSGGGGSTSGDGATATETATRATPTDAPVTATATPSADDLQRMSVSDLLVTARDNVTAAVTAYAGDGDALTDVTARSSSFDPAPVATHLFYARRAYEAADRQGISAEQEATIQALRRIETAIRLLIDAQVLLVEAHDDLEAAVTAIEFADAETVSSLTNRVANRQERATESAAALSRSQYETAVGSVGVLSRTAFVEKRRQLVTEASVLGDVTEAFLPVLAGVRQFARAQGARSSGAPYTAATLSRSAAADLGRGAATLKAAADSIPVRGRSFRPIATELLSVTVEKRDEARAFAVSIER